MADKREQIEAAATRAIQKDGLRSVSFRALADQVGVKSASVHYHFPTKSDLAHAVVDGYRDRFQQRLARIEREESTLDDKLGAFIQIFDDVAGSHDLCLCGMMASEMTALDSDTKQSLGRFFRDSEAWLERVLAAHDGEWASPLTGAEVARVLMAGLEGGLLLDRIAGGNTRIEAIRALTRTLVG